MPCRRSARNKARAVADSSCIPSSRYVFTHKYNMFAVVKCIFSRLKLEIIYYCSKNFLVPQALKGEFQREKRLV